MQGENITASYISVLKNTDGRTASESVSRAIAKACGSPFDDLLVVQAYLDSAPESIITLLSGLKETTLTATLKVLEKACPQESFEELKIGFETAMNFFNSTIIPDNSMEPLIPKGSKIEIDFLHEMKTGEIVHYKHIEKDEIRLGFVLNQLKINGHS